MELNKIFRSKKLLTLGTAAIAITPIAGVVACAKLGDSDNDTSAIEKELQVPIKQAKAIDAGKKVIRNYIGNKVDDIQFIQIPKEKFIKNNSAATDNDVYDYQVINGKLILKASSGVAFAHGFYEWVKENGYGMVDWGGIHNIKLPDKLINTSIAKHVVSPYKIHYYLNPVSFGYTMAYWHEKEWLDYLNWMAMHGYDTTLALTGTEGVFTRVFKKIGLDPSDFQGFYNSPALAPWQRMGNISGWKPNPWQESYDNRQIVLQSKVLNHMRERNITPIVQGFGGFVPNNIAKAQSIYDENYDIVNDLTSTSWGGWPARYKSNMIDPKKEQFRILVTETIKMWQKLFGSDLKYFLSDSFNEMAAPSSEDALTISKNIYEGMQAADRDSIWVTQGWMLVYQRGEWPSNKFASLVGNDSSGNKAIPDDKMLILDFAEDYAYTEYYTDSGPAYRYYNGFEGKNWTYGSVPTMGGKTSMTGIFKYLAKGGSNAIEWNKNHGNKSNLIGYGSSMEGFENNTIVQEVISDAGWQPKINSISDWVNQYVKTRYKLSGQPLIDAESSINKIISDGGALSNFVDHPKPTYQFGSVTQGGSAIVENDQQQQAYLDLIKAVKGWKNADPDNKVGKLLDMDVREWSENLIGTKVDQMLYQYMQQRRFRDSSSDGIANRQNVLDMLNDMDGILAGHPILNLKRWVDQAESWGQSEKEKQYLIQDAQNIITLWGQDTKVNNYALKTWAGMISGYYKEKIQYMFTHNGSKLSNHDDHALVEKSDFRNNIQPTKSLDEVLASVNKWFPQSVVDRIYKGSPILLNMKIDLRNNASHESSTNTQAVNGAVAITKNSDSSYTFRLSPTDEQKEKIASGEYMFELSRNADNRDSASLSNIKIQVNGNWVDLAHNVSLGSGTLLDINNLNANASVLGDIKVTFSSYSSIRKNKTESLDGIRQMVDASIMFRNLYTDK